MKKLIVILFILFSSSVCFAVNIAVGPSNKGSGSGADYNNWKAWADVTFVRGNTYYLVEGTYASKNFDTANSGSSVITIKKATDSDYGGLSNWSSSYGDGQTVMYGVVITTSYWTIDGARRNESNWKDGDAYGIKMDSINGNDQPILVPSKTPFYDVGNLTVKYVYFMGHGPDGAAYQQEAFMIWTTGSNINIQRNYIYNTGRDHIFIIGMDNGLIEYNYFYLNESTPEQHSESIALEYGSDNWIIRYNIWEACEGTCFILGADCDNIEVYGNVFRDSEWMGNGIFAGWSHTPMGTGGKFYNNTIVNVPRPYVGVYSSGVIAYNNLFYNWQDDPTFTGTHDYNAFQGSNAFGESHGQTGILSSKFTNYAGGNYALSSATNAGTSLSSPYNQDMNGNTRGGDGTWDRGAFEFGGIHPDILPPTNFHIVSQ